MRRNGRLFIILGVGMACLAVALGFIMFQSAASSQANANAKPAQVRVVVASKDIPAHTVIREGDLAEEMVDRDLLNSTDFATNQGDVIGRAPKFGLVKGQRLRTGELEVPGLTNDVEKGKRAVAIPVDRLQLAGGLLRDQDRVDIIFSVKVSLSYILPSRPYEIDTTTAADKTDPVVLPATAPGEPSAYVYPGEPGSRFKIQNQDKKGDPLSKVVLQNIKVLRVVNAAPPQQNQQSQPAKQTDTDIIILEVTDEQAEVMKFVLDNGASFTFALRGQDDNDLATTGGITYDLLVTNYQLPAPKSVRLPGEKQP